MPFRGIRWHGGECVATATTGTFCRPGPDWRAMPHGDDARESILSHSERDVAEHLREHPEATPGDVAEARGADPEATGKAVERIREKTDRALATLVQSPFAAEAAAELDPDERAAIRAAIEAADGE